MSGVRLVPNSGEIRAFLKSEEVAALVKSYADGIAHRAGEGYASDTYQTPGRVVSSAYTDTVKAMRSNAKHQTLLRALGQGG